MPDTTFIQNLSKGASSFLKRIFNNPYKKAGLNWLNVKYLKHAPPGKLKHHLLYNHKLWFTRPQEFLHGLREIFVDEIYQFNANPEPFIIDCGSNIGLSIVYFKHLYPQSTIIGFEPDEHNFRLLQKNIESFNFKDVIVHKAAVWIDNNPLEFDVTGTMGSSIANKNIENTTTVNAVRLKDIISRNIDFLKIDIEGAEYAVLKDIAEKLHFVNHLFVEYHGKFSQNQELIEMLQLINDHGFKFYIKEAATIHTHPFIADLPTWNYDVQLNIFCIKNKNHLQ